MRAKSSTGFFVLLIMLAFIAGACGGPETASEKPSAAKTDDREGDPKKARSDDDQGKDVEAVPVQATRPRIGDISSHLLFSSNVDSEMVVDIYPMTTGIIERITRDEGDRVKRGTILVILDDREAAINEEKARINYQQLKSEYERQKEIFEREMISKDEFDRTKFNMETARLDWKQKKLLLSYTRITSPIDGVVTRRYIKVGNKIGPSDLAFSVIHTREKIAVVNVPEQEVDNLFLKQNAFVITDQREFPGYVKRISPAIDPETGTFKVTVAVPDEKNRLTVGQFVNVKIIKKVHKDVVLLSKEALLFEGGKTFIFVVNDENRAVKREIELGFDDGHQVEVLENLSVDDRVVTAGKSSLKSETLIKIVEPTVVE